MTGWWIVSVLLLVNLGATGWVLVRMDKVTDELRALYQKSSRGPAR